ncbi:SIR2-like domain-containing protein [Cryobacterium luteum]|nr:SIR2-like domain-containing protein [Cryobacterium luteum]
MPTLRELQSTVLKSLNVPAGNLDPFNQDLEQWMSYLSIDQPWLSDQDNMRNRALFEDASLSVHASIDAAEKQVLENPYPIWLLRLVWFWCRTQAHVVTFNYDLLIERMLSQLSVAAWSDVYAIPLTERLPPSSHLMFGASTPDISLLRLYKLHGSINWYYAGDRAPVNERIVETRTGLRWWPDVMTRGDLGPRYTSLFSDLKPLVIPPTVTKSAFYSNLSLRAQWAQAATAMRSAERLTVMGYSFPPSDLGARHFVSNSIGKVPISVVDFSPEVRPRIEEFLGNGRRHDGMSGPSAIQDYVDRHCGDVIAWGSQTDTRSGVAQPYLTMNGRDVLPARGPGEVAQTVDGGDLGASEWLQNEVETRWPGLTEHPLPDIRPPSTEHHSSGHIAYLDRSANP